MRRRYAEDNSHSVVIRFMPEFGSDVLLPLCLHYTRTYVLCAREQLSTCG
ncbi:MAG: hypothetical protein HOE53_01915 [Candidatus Magasanikbacteria bacterium]|nr:hypothetical protein [Candidatus Magasanikbacteria bacterium]